MKVLVADDETVSRRLLETSLRRWGYDVVVASDGVEAWQLLQRDDAPNLALLDWLMPGIDGVQLCRKIRECKKDSYTYVVMLTGKCAKDNVVEGLEAGADDYLTKPFDPQELKVRLRTGKRIVYLMEQLVAAREALRDLAMHDQLTGLLNRSAILDLLDSEISRASRQKVSLGLVLVDLDRFKTINDTYGHPMGDQVLREMSQLMRSSIRPYDAVGRYGGEEFLIVLSGCDQVNAVSHAERLRSAISRAEIHATTGELVQVTASFGVTVSGHGVYPDAPSLILAADAALYEAKHGGRNRVEFAAAELLTP